jgi:hypothetical protein
MRTNAQPLKIYIGYDDQDRPVGVILARNLELAEAYWLGTSEQVCRTEEIDIQTLDPSPYPIFTLLSSTLKQISWDKTCRIMKRGK